MHFNFSHFIFSRVCIRSQSYESFQMVPSSPSCGSDSGLTSDHDTIGPVSSPYQTFKIEEDHFPVTTGLTSSKSWDNYAESLDVLDDLIFKNTNDENASHLANQVKIETGDDIPINVHANDWDIHELLSGGASGSGSGFVDSHDDSSTDLFPDLGDVSSIDSLITTY